MGNGGSPHSECILLGRTLGISNQEHDLATWAMNRLCNGWKRRPKTWGAWGHRVKVNPHWKDPFIRRETLIKLRSRIRANK